MSTHQKLARTLVTVVAVFMLHAPAWAADQDLAPASGDNGIQVFSGGVGDDDMNYIKGIQHDFSSKFLFTETNGDFLSDLPVTIRNKQGDTVVSTVTKGPILLVNLPVGQYVVSATEGDVTRDQKFSVSSHALRTYQLRFPSSGSLTSDNNN